MPRFLPIAWVVLAAAFLLVALVFNDRSAGLGTLVCGGVATILETIRKQERR